MAKLELGVMTWLGSIAISVIVVTGVVWAALLKMGLVGTATPSLLRGVFIGLAVAAGMLTIVLELRRRRSP